MSRCVVYVSLCYVLVLFVSGGWYSSCSITRPLLTRHFVKVFHLVLNFLYDIGILIPSWPTKFNVSCGRPCIVYKHSYILTLWA